jgi:hypothetical protein
MSVANEQVQPKLLLPHLLHHIVVSERGVGSDGAVNDVLWAPEQPRARQLDSHDIFCRRNLLAGVIGSTAFLLVAAPSACAKSIESAKRE